MRFKNVFPEVVSVLALLPSKTKDVLVPPPKLIPETNVSDPSKKQFNVEDMVKVGLFNTLVKSMFLPITETS